MAIMKALFAASVLASLVSAIPMPGLPMEKRAEVFSTYTHTTWTTVRVTTTIYYDGDAPPTPTPEAPAATPEAPAATPAEPTPTPQVAAPAPPAPEVASSPSPAVSAGNFAEAPTPSPAAPASTVNVQPKAAGPCEGSDNKCTGDITYYNGGGGYGACGTIIDDNANTIALPVGLMGSQSNGNPFCGRSVTIIGTDGSPHTATVADKCMGCAGDSIDLTPVLFKAVAPAGDGRVAGISWYFN